MKLAVTLRSWVILAVHGLVPVQAPFQPVKLESLAGVAVRVTVSGTLRGSGSLGAGLGS